MSKHTQGEWYVSADAKEGHYAAYELDINVKPGTQGLATVWIEEIIPTEEELANAKLIAAAPNMLEALSLYEQVLLSKYNCGKNSQEHIDACNYFNTKRKAALLKATT